MPIPTYTPGYPPDGSSLGQTKKPIRDNLDGTFQTLAIDHVDNNGMPGSNPAGYHTVIHQVTQASPPAAIPGVNQVFSMLPPDAIPSAGDTQLFTLTGNGGLSQMSGSTNGCVWCSGILFQWGTIAPTTASNVPVDFTTLPNFKFPNNVYNIQVTRQRPAADPGSAYVFYVDNSSISTSGFAIKNRDGHSYGYFWFAIGN